MNNILKGILLCTISGIAFGGQWIVSGNALKTIDPFYFTFIRYLIVSICLLFLLLIKEGYHHLKFEGKSLKLWFYGTMAFTLYNFLAFTGQKLLGDNGAIIGSIMMSLIPTVSLLISSFFTKNKPNFINVISTLLAFIGVFFVISKGNFQSILFNKQEIFPILLMLISVIAWVIYTMGVNCFKSWSSLRYTTLTCLLGNISSIIIIFILTKISYINVPNISLIFNLKWEFLYMSIIAGVIGVYTWNFGNLLLKPINGALFINLVPIVTFIISAIIGYSFSIIELLGAIMVIISLFINNIHQRYLSKKTKILINSTEMDEAL